MDYSNLKNLTEAYSAVYDEELREEYLEEDYSFIDGLDDELLEEAVEEVIYDLLDEGYGVDEVEALFEETFLSEATVTYGRGDEAGQGKVTTGTGSLRAAKVRHAARKAAKREERKEKIKQTAKDVISNIKKGVKRTAKKAMVGAQKAKQALSGIDRGAERAKRQQKARMVKTARQGIKKAVTGKADTTYRNTGAGRKETASSGDYNPPAKTVTVKSKTARVPQGSKKDVTGKVGAGAAGTIRSKTAAGSGDGPSSSGRALPPSTSKSSSIVNKQKTGKQNTALRGRLRMSKGEQSQPKVTVNAHFEMWVDSLLNEGYDLSMYTWNEMYDMYIQESETVDVYDIVLEHLMVEGYADTLEQAEAIMVNMSEEWKNQILNK